MTSELHLKALNEKNNEMKRVLGKWFLLMRDNAPSYISNTNFWVYQKHKNERMQGLITI